MLADILTAEVDLADVMFLLAAFAAGIGVLLEVTKRPWSHLFTLIAVGLLAVGLLAL